MAKGGLGRPKVSPGPAMPCPATPYGQDTPETAVRQFQGWPACRAPVLRPSSIPLDTPHCTPIMVILMSFSRPASSHFLSDVPLQEQVNQSSSFLHQRRFSWGIHGLSKVLLGPTIPYHSMPCGWPPLKWPYIFFRDGSWVGSLQPSHDPLGGNCMTRGTVNGQVSGHNDTPFGRPTPGRPIGRPGVGRPSGVVGVFSYYLLLILFF
jgi:hypothetical protein